MKNRKGALALAAGASLAVFAMLRGRLRRYEIAESSMEPQLYPGDYVIAAVARNGLQRGDIVIVPHPEIGSFDLAKRVIGLPGELVALNNGQVHIDGMVLAEPWADGPTRPDGEWRLAGNELFVLGDNRRISAADSRTIGPVALSPPPWRIIARYWPPTRLGRIRMAVSGR